MATRTTIRALTFRLIVAVLTLLPAATLILVEVVPAAAQQQQQMPRKGRTLFDMLFGAREREPEVQVQPKAPRPRQRSSAGAAASPAQPPAPAAVEKAEDARTVLVIGDFMAEGVAEGLGDAFAQSPNVQIVSRTNGSSGMVRDDHYDWPGSVAALIEETKPAAVVIMVGSNDRQQMPVAGTRERVRSEAWTAEYQNRAKRLADEVRKRSLPLYWVGLPAFKHTSANEDLLAFNDIYRATVEQAGGEFIDIWDGFVDENGAFASFGPDMNGQRVRLRNSDGLTLTRAGKRKVAFYLERPLERVFGSGARQPGGIEQLAPGGTPAEPVFDPSKIDRTAPMALNDPALDGGSALMGADVRAKAEPVGVQIEKLVSEGVAPAARAGRADDFATQSRAAENAVPEEGSSEVTATIAKIRPETGAPPAATP